MKGTERKTHPKITPEKVQELSNAAKEIDADVELRAAVEKAFSRIDKARDLIGGLRKIRLAKGLSYPVAGELADMDGANLHKLEIRPDPNPTINTLLRYAEALGVDIEFKIVDRAGDAPPASCGSA